ncbi:MAG: hypothetical protein K2X86_04325 [Cytophagaceae bacterium]|nr:hypothetical protein [Cytophagaceae bacterium]
MEHHFLVEYHVTRTLDGHGEFSKDQIVEKFTMISVLDDLNEIFTDIFDLHRFNSITGIKILKVEKVFTMEENNRVLTL